MVGRQIGYRVMSILVFLILFASARASARAQAASAKITSVAGTEGCGGSVAVDQSGNAYFNGEHGIRKIALATGKSTPVSLPASVIVGGGLAVDPAGNLYIADFYNVIWKVAGGSGTVTAAAGTQEKDNGLGRRIPGPATQAFLRQPMALAFDSGGNLYIGEFGSITEDVLKVTAATGAIAGVRLNLYPAKRGDPDNLAVLSTARNRPVIAAAFAFDSDGALYVGDSRHNVVLKVPADGSMLQLVAGTGVEGYSGDGLPATQAKLDGPDGLAFDAAGNLYISDQGNHRIRMIAKDSGIITTAAGNGTMRNLYASVPGEGGSLTSRYEKADDGDGGPAIQARITSPGGIAFDRSGNLYICAGMLRKVSGVASPKN
jgi:sugar lactone lactonase YvrE